MAACSSSTASYYKSTLSPLAQIGWHFRNEAPMPMKLFYTGPVINAELLVAMLEKHGIVATQEFVDPSEPDDGSLDRPAKVLVPEADYDRAHQLFYAEREDEL